MTDIKILDPLTFPLVGQQLIEASAGTGKTYTITALYLRLLLGLGNINDKPLGPDQILVVTFTEAATEELRDRIRSRMVDARSAFLQKNSEISDPFLLQLKQQSQDHAQAIKLLEQAIRQMDEAAIFTIHGFCQRMLKQHAFESGSLFESELTKDDQSLIRSAVLDFWRNTIYPLKSSLTELVLQQCWNSPEKLMAELRGLLNQTDITIEPDLSGVDLHSAYDERLERINQFKQSWLANGDDLVALIQASGVNKRSYTKASVPKWLSQIDHYATSEQLEPSKTLFSVMERFTNTRLSEKTDKGEQPSHPLFSELEAFLVNTMPIKEILLGKALNEVSQRLDLAKKQYQLQTFDDLLTGLSDALNSTQGTALSDAIQKQYPVAMIDEFQDTDPLQYGIFTTLYADQFNTALVMIGDPKQAIYAFRGADIFTYIKARRSVKETFTLETNWRSTSAMVEAVNTLFQSADSAFIYDADIPFHPVKAADKINEGLKIQEEAPPALTFWSEQVDVPLNKGEYLSLYAQSTAAEIDRLLSGEAKIKGRTAQGADIAVLVRDRYEAEEVRRALAVYEHPCVYLSSQDSVFNSIEAIELSLILAAIENPQNERSLKAALATELFQLEMSELDRFNSDENAWESVVSEFTLYKETWLKRGVLPMLNQLLHQRNLAAETLEQVSGERRLTNLLHIAELLQQASSQLEGSTGLLRWFNEQIVSPGGAIDEQVLRLESERNLVTIVTVHKSKGLEYPIVFLPFASNFREAKTALYHDEQGRTVLDMSAQDQSLEMAEKERLAEELRLLYVALTRSVYCCYVGVSDIRIGNSKASRLGDSALGYLLLQSGLSLEESLARLQQLSDSIQVMTPINHGAQKDLFAIEEVEEKELSARRFKGRIDRDWRVSSYSALSRHSGSAYIPELPGLDLEVADEHALSTEIEIPEGQNIFTFPKGANAGTFLHTVFEEISFPQYIASASDAAQEKDENGLTAYQAQISDQLVLAGYDAEWLPVIEQLITNVLKTDLNGKGLALGNVEDTHRLVEMEFMLRADHVTVSALEALIRKHDRLSAQAAPLSFEPLRGMLKGYIDLLFREGQSYYILDYKSNHLGYEANCYNQAALEQAMVEHRYDLQYLLYSLAVHRLLKQRIPNYDYNTHFGGVYYLFLRGMNRESDLGVFSCRPDWELIDALDRMFSGEEI